MKIQLITLLLTFFSVGAIFAQTGTLIDPINAIRGTSTNNQLLRSNGSGRLVWAGISDLISSGTGISINGSGVITNTSPDQTVVFTNGTGISVTGTYPNFTITNTVSATPFQTLSSTTTVNSPILTLSNGGGSVNFNAGDGMGILVGGSITDRIYTFTPIVKNYQTFLHSGNTSTLSDGGGIISVVGTGAATVTQSAGVYTVNVATSSAPLYTLREPFTVGTNIAVGGTFTTTGVTLPSNMNNFMVFIDGVMMDYREDVGDTNWDYERTGASQLTFNRTIAAGSKILVVY